MATQTTYVELQVTSHFSFLRGASSPDELFAAAALLGHSALGLTDLGSVAGLVRGWEAQKATGVRMIAGTRVRLDDGRMLLLYPTDKPAWSRLTRLLTLGKSRAGKGGCALAWEDVVTWNAGLIAILLPDLPGDATRSDLGDDAVHGQEVGRIGEFGDQPQFVIDLRPVLRGHAVGEPAFDGGVGKLFERLLRGQPVDDALVGILVAQLTKVEGAAARDLGGGADRVGEGSEATLHLFRGF
jgi:hypothetical protein